MNKKIIFPDEHTEEGHFERQEDAFNHWVRKDDQVDFPAASGRYHLYVSLACPWAHRIIIMRKLKSLENVIGMTIVNPIRTDEDGWEFFTPSPELDPAYLNTINPFSYLKEAYIKSDPHFQGRVTVPVLWDKVTEQIVSNNDDHLLRMLNREFDQFTEVTHDFCPEAFLSEIDKWNKFIYDNINNGVYLAGFASTQSAYEKSVRNLFDALEYLEDHLQDKDYIVGDSMTETDIRLFVTLVRFDAVYFGHFKCNWKQLRDYPALYRHTKNMLKNSGIRETVNFDHIKRHYYQTHPEINPTGIVPIGPFDLETL